ncbi:hypothetical protein BDW42DRAFT_165718 [Aspergillus taichungensis]|uniref:Uncharacterized protein n=1 Tax=Aspergillus taichungensis TaxID=482145 RepID=A0A2J5HZX9_9EURO|nr:hypothetical protein BDW42DRAFT_165718 [Aspergillus taichungensis]
MLSSLALPSFAILDAIHHDTVSTMALSAISLPSITYHPEASNAIPVNSPAVAQTYVESFLLGWNGENLQLKLSSETLPKDIRCILQKASEKNLCRWEYDPEYQILKVKAMGSPLHVALKSCIDRSLHKAKFTVLTPDEGECILNYSIPTILSRPPQTDPKLNGGKNCAAWFKESDIMIVFQKEAGGEEFIQVVIEIGFSESYHDLVRDASQWLLRSDGQVKLVAIAKIEENKRQLSIHQKTDQFKRTRDQLVAKHGDNMSREIYETCDSECTPQVSSAGLYKALDSELAASGWVGPISVFIEVWRLRNGEPSLTEPRIDILPIPTCPRDLILKVTDLIPVEHRASFPNFDASRTITIDMTCFRLQLERARMRTALIRALKVIRPLDKEEIDPEFLPPTIS